jgi:general stress protein CsbA
MEEKDIQNELASIRSIMERSSKFISLSGLSGILAGVYALIGAYLAYRLIYQGPTRIYDSLSVGAYPETITYLIIIAVAVLAASLITGFVLSSRQAKRKGQPIWGKISQTLMFHMATPLVTGGLLILILLSRGYYGIVTPSTLIFYGLSLVSASNFTFGDVKYLGMLEIILGLIAACLPGYGLLFWAIGFGVLHIIYGSMMYLKYDK